MRIPSPKQAQPAKADSVTLARFRKAVTGSEKGAGPSPRPSLEFAAPTAPRPPDSNGRTPEAAPGRANGFAHDFSSVPVYGHAPVTIQPKLAVNLPGDAYEQEADLVAEKVTAAPLPRPWRAGGNVEGGARPNTPAVMAYPGAQPARATGSPGTAAPPLVHEVLRSHGHPLDPSAREFMEPRFGRDFGHVRVHADARAAESARAVGARAYAVGHNLVFGAGQYAPRTGEGRRLIAHELTHVIQQGRAASSGPAAPLTLRRQTPRAAAATVTDFATMQSLYADARSRLRAINPRLACYYSLVPLTVTRAGDSPASRPHVGIECESFAPPRPTPGGPAPGSPQTAPGACPAPPAAAGNCMLYQLEVVVDYAAQQMTQRGDISAFSSHGHSGSNVQTMSIYLNPAPGRPPTVASLTEALYHEGLHMLRYMENRSRQARVPGAAGRAPLTALLAQYRAVAQAVPEFNMLLAELSQFIQLEWRRTRTPQPARARDLAEDIFMRILEEKTHFDLSARVGLARPLVALTTRLMASQYLEDYLWQGARVRLDQTSPYYFMFRNAAGFLGLVLNEIDLHGRPAPDPSLGTPAPRAP